MRLIDADALRHEFEVKRDYLDKSTAVGRGGYIAVNNAITMLDEQPTVDAMPVDKVISAIQEMIESIDEDFPLLDFNSRYMMERGMRMSLIQIKEHRTGGGVTDERTD